LAGEAFLALAGRAQHAVGQRRPRPQRLTRRPSHLAFAARPFSPISVMLA
jgi:hypothetical protein